MDYHSASGPTTGSRLPRRMRCTASASWRSAGCAWASRSSPSRRDTPAERPARAHAPGAEEGSRQAGRRQHAAAAGAVRHVRRSLQPRAAASGLGHEGWTVTPGEVVDYRRLTDAICAACAAARHSPTRSFMRSFSGDPKSRRRWLPKRPGHGDVPDADGLRGADEGTRALAQERDAAPRGQPNPAVVHGESGGQGGSRWRPEA